MMPTRAAILLAMAIQNPQVLAEEKLQEPIQAAALNHYLQLHPPTKGERVCVSVGGYKSPSKTFRAQLRKWRLNRSPTCHLRDGQVAVGTTYAAMNAGGIAEVEVSKHEFGDISVAIDTVSYRLEKKPEWTVTWEGAPRR
jgi:hypothetical protein